MGMNENIIYDEALITAYIAGELDENTANKVSIWIKQDVKNEAFYNAVLKTWNLTGSIKPKPVVVNTTVAWQKVRSTIDKNEEHIIPIATYRKTFLRIAAVIIGLLGIFGVIQLFAPATTIEKMANEQILIDQLEDGSIVTLNKNSILTYPKTFAKNERRVELRGEAFFDIEKNTQQPFIIDLPSEAYVKVLGTSFNVKAEDNDSLMEVFVKTGRVEFGMKGNNIILSPGEKGQLNRLTGEVKKMKSTSHLETYWLTGELKFQESPLTEVVAVLNNVFPESVISLNCPNAEAMLITSPHQKGENLDDILNVVASVHNLKIEKRSENSTVYYVINCP